MVCSVMKFHQLQQCKPQVGFLGESSSLEKVKNGRAEYINCPCFTEPAR